MAAPRSRTLYFVLGVAAPCLMLGVGLPSPVVAADRGRSGFSLPLAPAERALSGGLRRLRTPGSLMIRLPAGTFRMGSTHAETLEAAAGCAREPFGFRCNESTFADEMPAHDVSLSAYWLDRTEVTVEAYARCVEVRRCKALPFAEGATRFDKPKHPASLVTFDDAVAYCKFRGARLPTEAEFERAARGLAKRRFPWGNLYNSRAANHGRLGWDASDSSDGFAELAPVGSYLAGRTPEGLLDLAGNVAEWVSDRYLAHYTEGPQKNPSGPAAPPGSSERVVRGGSYAQAAPWLRGAARRFQEPGTRRPNLGFRCARSDVPR